ncbi:MAG: hypothetical protein K6C32_03730 [Bacilli bacterium]|nr:hypothetical protein [Bacilli bacterium]
MEERNRRDYDQNNFNSSGEGFSNNNNNQPNRSSGPNYTFNKNGHGFLNMNFDYVVNLILAIFPLTSYLLGGITRIMRGHVIAGIVELFLQFLFPLFWIFDIITVATTGDITFCA